MKKFEELRVWQEAIDLNRDIYHLFESLNKYWLQDQILRSSLSIHSNIAEGYDRGTKKYYIQFLSIARASCSELRSQLLLSKAIGLNASTVDALIQRSEKVSAMLNKLIGLLKADIKK